MKKLAVILFISVSLFAQGKDFQFNVGLNRSWLIYDLGILNDYKTDFIPKLSMSFNYNFIEYRNIRSSIGIRYYHLGRSLTINYDTLYKQSIKINHYLLSFPLLLKYRFGIINTDLILNAETSYILTSNISGPNTVNNLITERNITNEMNRLLFSVGAGFEYTFNIGEETFGVAAVFNYVLTKIPKDGIFRDSYNQEFTWVGYKAREAAIFLSYHFK